MHFSNPDLGNEFDRVLKAVNEDPYESKYTLGLRDAIRAHFLLADFFITEGRPLGGIGPRDLGLLESALNRAWFEFGGVRKWIDPIDQIATTLFGLIKDHPFYDANKRTALLCTLYLLQGIGRTPKRINGESPEATKKRFEDFTVEIAEMGIVKRARYKALTQEEEDPEIKYISQWLRKNTREIDGREYWITYRDLRRILARYGFEFGNPVNNGIDILKVESRSGLMALITGTKETRTRVGRIGYPGDNRQVAKGDIRKVRKMCGLTSAHGIDSQTFYYEVDDMNSLIAEYQENLRRLADR